MANATTAPAQAAAPPPPGAFFDIPGIPGGSTQWTEQDETTTNAAVTLQQASPASFSTITPFRQTDIVADWDCWLNVTQTYTASTGTVTASAWAPFTAIGAVKLNIQNQYASIDVESGIDWAIFSILRPRTRNELVSGVNGGANPAGDPVGGTPQGYLTGTLAQPNLVALGVWAPTVGNYQLNLRIPAGQFFDNYFDLSVDGQVLTQGHPALVSPQYMAGTTRVITPEITMNSGSGATSDKAAAVLTGAATFTGSATARFRRQAIYASGNPSILPPAYAWQYRQKTTRRSISGVSEAELPLPLDSGQVLAVYCRMFDPAAAAGVGAPISLANLQRVQLQFGSGLIAFDANGVGGVPAGALLQRRWMRQHGLMLPPGVFCIDLAMDEGGKLTNKRALNTLNTAGIQLKVVFTAAQSASAYAVLGIESLVYVA